MPAYHQMGHDSQNLLGEVTGYRGAILSPVNESEADVKAIVQQCASDTFEFVFDPQLYFPRRFDRGRLAEWNYFPRDLETADLSSASWWEPILNELRATAERVGAKAICSPAIVTSPFTNDYYEAMRRHADRLVELTGPSGQRVYQTVLIRRADLATVNRAMEIASIVSNTKAAGVYLVLLSDVKARDEFREVEQIKGAMKLINVLERSQLPVLVGFSSSDVVLWKAAGATACATGKFGNLRRFSQGRFDENEEGGRLMAYYFEEGLLAFLRTSDLLRVGPGGVSLTANNPFGTTIQTQLSNSPEKPWVALGWRQYMHWFADVEARLTSGAANARHLVQKAEQNWQMLENNDVFMEERTNDGGWLRPWLRAIVEFNK